MSFSAILPGAWLPSFSPHKMAEKSHRLSLHCRFKNLKSKQRKQRAHLDLLHDTKRHWEYINFSLGQWIGAWLATELNEACPTSYLCSLRHIRERSSNSVARQAKAFFSSSFFEESEVKGRKNWDKNNRKRTGEKRREEMHSIIKSFFLPSILPQFGVVLVQKLNMAICWLSACHGN